MSKQENRRECIYCSDTTFPEVHEEYMQCKECGAATYKAFQTKEINFRVSKCPNAEECYAYDQYRPECESLTFTPRCLVALHEQNHVLETRLDNLLKQEK